MRKMTWGPVVVMLMCASAGAQTRVAANVPVTKLQPMPAEIQRRSQALRSALKPTTAAWVTQQARVEEQQSKLNTSALETAIRQRFGGTMAGADVNAMVFAVLTEATDDQDADLQTLMQEVQAQTEAKQSIRDLLDAVNAQAAANAKAASNTKCSTAFCQALPVKLAQIATETAQMPKPVRLQAPSNLTYGQLGALQAQLSHSMNSMNEMSEMSSMQLQMAMDRRSQFVQMLSNLLKSMSDTSAAIVSNLK